MAKKLATFTRVSGFNFFELILTLVILSLILSAAIPSYQQHLQITRRLDAKTGLLKLGGQLERYYLLHHSYEQASFANLGISNQSPAGFYRLKILHTSATTYSLAAIPQGTQQNDQRCATFKINHLGQKTISGQGTLAECWP